MFVMGAFCIESKSMHIIVEKNKLYSLTSLENYAIIQIELRYPQNKVYITRKRFTRVTRQNIFFINVDILAGICIDSLNYFMYEY